MDREAERSPGSGHGLTERAQRVGFVDNAEVKERVAGLWCWSAPHPKWTPGHGWQRDVWAYCVDAEDAVVVVDPITPLGDEARQLDEWIANRQKPIVVALSRAGHFRDSAAFSRQYEASIYGDARAGEHVPPDVEFHAVSAGDALPGGACALAFDVPGLDHTPTFLLIARSCLETYSFVRRASFACGGCRRMRTTFAF
jgi:hypothetical protein